MANIAQYLIDQAALRWRAPDTARQVAALPYALVDGRVVFLLITSRRTGRWIVPKGSIIGGETPWRSAEIEALEEAGVEGVVEREPIGTYRTIKRQITRHVIEVDLYPLLVTKQHDTWAEKDRRHRHWVLLREAKRLLSDAAVADFAVELCQRVLSQRQPTTHRIDA